MGTLTTESMSRSASPAQRRIFDLLLVIPFILLFLIQLWHHQLWRDEMNAWALTAASKTIPQLLGYVRYEAHGSVWYGLLWIVTRFTASPIALKCVEGVIGILIYVVLSLWAPFSRLEKILLYLSYFISFEYTVFSRMYGLCLLLVLTYVHFRVTHAERILFNTALLCVLANTDMMGVILSFALLVEYGIDAIRKRCSNAAALRRLIAPASLYLLAVALAAWMLKPARHISWRTTHHMFEHAKELHHCVQAILSYIVVPWLPITDDFPQHFWNPWLWNLRQHPFIIAALPLVLSAILILFLPNLRLFLIYFVTALCGILFGHLIYMGSTRHYGITFVAFLAAYWMLRYGRPRVPLLGVCLLGVSAVGGIQAAIGQWERPFSNAGAAARWLRAHHLDKAALVGTPDTSAAGVAEQLERPMYFLDCSCSDNFLLFADRRDGFSIDQIPQRLAVAADQLHTSDMILINAYPLTGEQVNAIMQKGLRVEPLAQFTGAEAFEEDFFLYRIRQTNN